jgi:hypothetical protein
MFVITQEFYEFLASQCTDVTYIIFAKGDVAWLSWKYTDENKATCKNFKLATAAYAASGARRKLYC